MMNKKNILLIILIFTTVFTGFSQKASVKGVILDDATGHPIEFADISIQSVKDSTIVSGGVTNEKGVYEIKNIPTGKYHIHFGFMGYQPVIYRHILLEKGIRDFGIIKLKVSSENLKEVVIKSGKPAITYQVDKKVINAGSFPSASVAMDLLQNIPSLQVSIDGRLTYRNDGVFIVLVNGKRVANGTERLKQIPASQIDKIEIITNPSAKYSAEGTAGIINVVLKRNRLKGYVINSSIGLSTRGRRRWSFAISKNTQKSGWFVNGQWAKYINWDGEEQSTIDIHQDNNEIVRLIDEKRDKTYYNNYLNMGYNYDITPKDEIEFSFTLNPLGNEEHSHSVQNVKEKYFQNNTLIDEKDFRVKGTNRMIYSYFAPAISYKHKFNKGGTKYLSIDASYDAYLQSFNEKQISEVISGNNHHKEGHLYNEENEQNVDIDVDFSYPINDKYTIETGLGIHTDYIPDTTIQNGIFDAQGNLTTFNGKYQNQQINFMRNVYSAFVTFKGKYKKWSYKLGLRDEITDRISDFSYILTDTPNEEHIIPASKTFSDLFPSASVQYEFSDDKQLSLSYARRISRPNYFKLMPLRQYDNPFQYTIGNALLVPTYGDSYELSYINSWDKDYVSVEIFIKKSYNISTYINEVDNDGLIYLIPKNFGTSLSVGSVLSGNYHISAWWNSNLSLSLYQYSMNIRTDKIHKDVSQFNSDIKFNHTFTLPKRYSVRLNLAYFSPGISAQSEGSPYFMVRMSVKKNFGKHWSALIYTNHILGDIVTERTTKTPDLSIKNTQTAYRYFGLQISYKFNNRK